jgi:flavin-dependent dehydrogenase
VALVDGVAVTGVERAGHTVTGLRLGDGQTLPGDLVVLAGGRRMPLGVDVPEREEDTGIVYFSRFYRLREGAEPPDQAGPIAADLGYLKFAVFQGDNRTFSVTFAAPTADDDLRRRLLDPERFDAAARAMSPTAAWLEPDRSEAITEVHVMARLVNRRRTFLDDEGGPRFLGLHAVGDSHTCTNPLYGRGCALALVQAQLLADAVAAHPDDPVARAIAYEEASAREIDPWYRAAVLQDREAREQAAAALAGTEGEPDTADDGTVEPKAFLRELLRDGLMPAVRVDAVVLRAFLRMFNLLTPPDALVSDPDLINRVLAVYGERDSRPPDEPLGPERDELLRRLAA